LLSIYSFLNPTSASVKQCIVIYFSFMHSLTPETELIQRLYARDEQAMTIFYQHYRQSLYHFIWRVVRQDELAEDILQESMLKFWLSFAAYDATRGRLFTWALNLSRNLAIDRLREARYKQAKQTTSLEEAEWHQLVATGNFEPEHIGVRDWLSALPAGDCELMETLYFKGYTQAEASVYLKLPLGTVKSRVKRIIKHLTQVVT
jgi:RNA polymerase sigma-70 factor (ECF subfamily)